MRNRLVSNLIEYIIQSFKLILFLDNTEDVIEIKSVYKKAPSKNRIPDVNLIIGQLLKWNLMIFCILGRRIKSSVLRFTTVIKDNIVIIKSNTKDAPNKILETRSLDNPEKVIINTSVPMK